MTEKTIFSRIIDRECPAYIVAEDKEHIAFLDIAPETKGHTLVVPKVPIDYFFDLEDRALECLISFAKRVALGIEKVVPCFRISVKVHGLDVPHAHVHLIPLVDYKSETLVKSRPPFTQEEMQNLADAIKQKIAIAQ